MGLGYSSTTKALMKKNLVTNLELMMFSTIAPLNDPVKSAGYVDIR